MSNQTNTPPPAAQHFDAFVVKKFTDKENKERSTWSRIGVAFPHDDGKGFNLNLDAIPVDGKVVVRLYEAKGDDTES